ncbi:hypothetical protein AKO1_002294, partial [Acrasis kona]
MTRGRIDLFDKISDDLLCFVEFFYGSNSYKVEIIDWKKGRIVESISRPQIQGYAESVAMGKMA